MRRGADANVEPRGGGGVGIEAEGALRLIGGAHYRLKQYDEAMEHYERRLQVLLRHYGQAGAKREAKVMVSANPKRNSNPQNHIATSICAFAAK